MDKINANTYDKKNCNYKTNIFNKIDKASSNSSSNNIICNFKSKTGIIRRKIINSDNSRENQRKKRKEFKLAKKKEIQLEEIKKNNELEEQILDYLKCYICLSRIKKPRMCRYCKRMSCESCITKWLENHSICGICKNKVSILDMYELPFLEDMPTFFFDKIENNHLKNEQIINNKFQLININNKKLNKEILNNENNNSFKILNINSNKNNINNIFNLNDFTERTIIDDDKDICIEHGYKIDFYCIQCNKYFCGQCFVIFGKEVNNHNKHIIIKVEKINDKKINRAINEYNKKKEKKKELEYLISLCEAKKKENEIEKSQIIKIMNKIQNSYINKINNETKDIKNILHYIKNSKIDFQEQLNSLQKEINNLLIQDNIDFDKIKEKSKVLSNIDYIVSNLNNDAKEQSKISPKLFIESYQTDFLEIKIPAPIQQYQNNEEIINYSLKIIPNYTSKLIFKYFNNKIIISFILNIRNDLNSYNYLNFYSYIIFRSKKYGLELMNLSEEILKKNHNILSLENDEEKIYSTQILFDKFFNLCNEQNKLDLKVFITKSFCNE